MGIGRLVELRRCHRDEDACVVATAETSLVLPRDLPALDLLGRTGLPEFLQLELKGVVAQRVTIRM